MSRGCVL
ncbi:hypothetical protein AZE42_13096, partial [Rhizopogon vesiculosus]